MGRKNTNMAEAIRNDEDLFTVEEFYDVIEDGQKADLIDGVIYVASPDTKRSDQLILDDDYFDSAR